MTVFCDGVGRKTVPPKNLQNANRDFLPGLCRRWLSCTDRSRVLDALPLPYMSAIVECATTSLYERDLTKRLGKMSALSAFTPPPSRLLYEGERLVCVCGGRRCRQAATEYNGVWLGRMTARQTLYHTLVLVCGRASKGYIPKWGRASGCLWGVTLGPSARYSGQPQIWDAR